MDNRPIGMFDSGMGGLTVLKEFMCHLPGENVIYFGDTGRFPYGTRSKEAIIRFSLQNMRFLLSHNIKMIVIACNTASAAAMREVRAYTDIPVVGVVEPNAEMAVSLTRTKKIGIIGTAATINSKAWENAIRRIDDSVEIFSAPCPLFAAMIEEGWTDNDIAFMTAKQYLKPFFNSGIDTLVLGCTHYPLLKDIIRKVLGEGVTLIDPAECTALSAREIIADKNMFSDRTDDAEYMYYASDNVERIRNLGRIFLNKNIDSVDKVDIEEY